MVVHISSMSPFHILALLIWLCLATASPTAAAADQCERSCGGVDIPYPFGLKPGCALLPDFNLTCNTSGDGKPYYYDVEVLSISLQEGQARMKMDISSYCYNTTSREMNGTDWSLNFTDTPYRFSDSGNKFTAVGCRTLAFIDDKDGDGKLTTGCVATCPRDYQANLTDGTCSGIGCCQTAIPKGLQYYYVSFDPDYNTTEIYDRSRCSYAALVEASNFSFSPDYATSSAFNDHYKGQAPLLVDWAIGNEKCEVARLKPNYACVSNNSECFNSLNGPGYICNCSKGFQGNPYLKPEDHDSCRDINECELSNLTCYGKCVNKPGGFDCLCDAGSRGNASIPGGCRKDFLPLKARAGIGAGACVLIGLFGFLVWEVIRHKRHIRKQAFLRQTDEFFQQHGGQLLLEMMKVEGNDGFTLYDREEIETATNNFDKMHVIGEGGQGTVYRAVLDGVAVAIKKCKEVDESRRKDFVQELVILCRVIHPNVVKLHGCCLQFEAPMLVYEFVQNKTLQEMLDLQRSRTFHVTLGTRLRIAAESADALAHLHSLPHPILHGDVKPSNILLAEGLVAKVSDFGCSTINEKTQVVPKGTPGYLDPDYLLEYQLTAKNDVYSFGVILLELLTGKRPLSKDTKTLTSMFQEAMADGTLLDLLDSDIVDETSMSVIHQAAMVASKCLVVPGTARPTMRWVAEEFHRLALLADELQQYPQPPLALEGLRFMEMGSTCTTSSWYTRSKTSGVYSLENKAMLSTELAR